MLIKNYLQGTRKSNVKHAMQHFKRAMLLGNIKMHSTKDLCIRVSIVERSTSILRDSGVTDVQHILINELLGEKRIG